MVTELLEFFENIMQRRLELEPEDDSDADPSEEGKLKAAFEPVISSAIVFCGFVLLGTSFFTLYPGENKTAGQGIYMSLITLSTVGFGAFTPTTHGGMVFGAFWMLFGVASLASLVSSRAAFAMALMNFDDDSEDDEEKRRPARTTNIAAAAHEAGLKVQK